MVKWWQEFSQRPLVAHGLRAVERFNVRGGGQFAAAITYFSVLSMVPILMLASAVLGLAVTVFFPDSMSIIEDWLTDNLHSYGDLGTSVLKLITGILSNWASIGLVGLVIALWTGANWIGNLKRASRALMRADYDNPPKAPALPLDVLANFGGLVMVFVGVVISSVATSAATTFGKLIGDWLGTADSVGWSLLTRGVSLLISLTVATLLFWWMFGWFAVHPVPRRLLWIGAAVGAVGLVILQLLAGYLIGVFSRNLAATLFGPVIILMLFLNLFATLILYVASWLATATVVPASVPIEELPAEPEPEPVERKPGELYVSAEVARRSMGVGLGTGYTIGAATGLGLGAAVAALLNAVFSRRAR